MTRILRAVCVFGWATVCVAAHHDISQGFDESRLVEVRGVVNAVEWRNPHTVITIEATNPDGVATLWRAETQASPHALERRGWSRTSVAVGASVVVRGFPARQGSAPQPPALVVTDVTVDGGTRLDASSATRWQSGR